MSLILAEVAKQMNRKPALSYDDFVAILEQKGLRRAESKNDGNTTELSMEDAFGMLIGMLRLSSESGLYVALLATNEPNILGEAWDEAGLDPYRIW